MGNNSDNLNPIIRGFFNLINEILNVFYSNKIVIIVVGITSSLLGFIYAYTSESTYKAELRFIVKNEGQMSPLGGFLGGLGSALGTGSIGSSLERTIEIASSDRIVGAALLSKIYIDGKVEILANSFIRLSGVSDKLGGEFMDDSIYFNIKDTIAENLSFPKRKLIKKLKSKLIPKSGKGIISRTFDRKSGVVTLTAEHHSEKFAIILVEKIFEKLREFYIEQMTAVPANNVLILEKKADSLKMELDKVQTSYARRTDQSFGLLFQEDKVDLKKIALREQMLLTMYSEVQKNLETFRFMNESAIPTLTIIDMPFSPIDKRQPSKILYAFSSGILGIIFILLIIYLKRWYRLISNS